MPLFIYTAMDSDGKEVRGQVDAVDLAAATAALSSQNLDVLEASEARRAAPKAAAVVTEASNRTNVISFAFEGKDVSGAVHQGTIQADSKRKAFEKLQADMGLAVSMLSPVGTTPSYIDYDLDRWQKNVPSVPATSAAPTPPVTKSLDFVKEAVKPLETKKTLQLPTLRAYHPLVSTLRLYAGWLLAWYALFMILGYYASVRIFTIDIPFTQAFYYSPLILRTVIALFLFLLCGTIHRAIRGKIISGFVLTIIAAAAFFGILSSL